jgi:hypothetical protein
MHRDHEVPKIARSHRDLLSNRAEFLYLALSLGLL